MKIYLLPYTNRTYFSYNKRASGIDEATLCQLNALQDAGHDVRMFAAFTNLHNHLEGIDYYKEQIPEGYNIKEYEKIKRNAILQKMFQSIKEFQPDVILSNFGFNYNPYEKLMSLDIPIIYMSHAVPGFWSDLSSADLLDKFKEKGNTLTCVSDYHAKRTKMFYDRDSWNFTIEADHVLFSSFSKKETVAESDGVVRHVSAANKEKSTFFIHKTLHDTDIKSEVFTTLGYLHSQGKQDSYVEDSLKNYPDSEYCKTNLDVDHSATMVEIGKSVCTFVGLASYDTFTITSLESLSRGVPILVKSYKGQHPAKEMLPKEYQQYVHIFENKEDFINKIKEWSNLTIKQRQEIADACYSMTSKKAYTDQLVRICSSAMEKYEKNENRGLQLDQFMI